MFHNQMIAACVWLGMIASGFNTKNGVSSAVFVLLLQSCC